MAELGDNLPTPRPGRPRKKKGHSKRRVSRALMQIAERSLRVEPREVDIYVPRELDIRIAEAMLSGALTVKDIAAEIQCSDAVVSAALKSPVACAWVSRAVHANVQHRLGMVDAAVLNRALGGDIRAADLLYKRYSQMTQRSVNLNLSASLAAFTDQDLDKMLQDYAAGEVIDVRPHQDTKDPADQGDPGAEGAA